MTFSGERTPDTEIVELEGGAGQSMLGILWHPPPDVPRKNVLVILSHGGLSHKVGANRVQYYLGRYFASQGCTVFRFDPEGMGDSEGRIDSQGRQDLFGNIESGLFKDSYRRALGYLASRFPNHRWVVSGVCGGAISSLLGGVESGYPIAAYALISCPVILDGLRFDYSRREPPATALAYLRLLAPKLLSPSHIWRFVTLKSDYKYMWKHLGSLLLRGKDKVSRKLFPEIKDRASAVPSADAKPAVGLSPHFVKAAREAMKKSKVLFIYGNNDGFLWEFTDLYAKAHLSQAESERVLRVVEHANHMFVWREWQTQAFELIDRWLSTDVLPVL